MSTRFPLSLLLFFSLITRHTTLAADHACTSTVTTPSRRARAARTPPAPPPIATIADHALASRARRSRRLHSTPTAHVVASRRATPTSSSFSSLLLSVLSFLLFFLFSSSLLPFPSSLLLLFFFASSSLLLRFFSSSLLFFSSSLLRFFSSSLLLFFSSSLSSRATPRSPRTTLAPCGLVVASRRATPLSLLFFLFSLLLTFPSSLSCITSSLRLFSSLITRHTTLAAHHACTSTVTTPSRRSHRSHPAPTIAAVAYHARVLTPTSRRTTKLKHHGRGTNVTSYADRAFA